MANVYIGQNYFDIEPGTGTPFEAHCPVHGSFTAWVPLNLAGSYVSMSQNIAPCPKCKIAAPIEDGFFDFAEKAFETLKPAGLTRQQVRRYALKASKASSLDDLIFQSRFINEALSEITKEAKQQPNPRSAVQSVTEIAKMILLVFGSAAAFGAGLITFDDVWDRYQKGEFFENHIEDDESTQKSPPSRLDDIEDRLNPDARKKTEDQHDSQKPWGDSSSEEI